MAVTVTTGTPYPGGFSAQGNSADWSGCEEIVAAVTGQRHYIERIHFTQSAVGVSFTIGAGESSSAVETVLLGPLYMSTGQKELEIVPKRPIVVPVGKSITVDASGAGSATIRVEGFTQ